MAYFSISWKPRSGYTKFNGSINSAIRSILPKDWVYYKLYDSGRDYFNLWQQVREYYTIGGQEYDRWVYDDYNSLWDVEYYTVVVKVEHHVYREFLQKKTIIYDTVSNRTNFYDSGFEEKLGGEVVTLG